MSDPVPTSLTKKLKRKAHLFYINTNFDVTAATPATPVWFLVGKDVEDMSIELNPDTETIKNILDEVTTRDNGYEPSISVDTYYANPGASGTPQRAFYEKIKDIAMNRKTGDDCLTTVLEVLVDMDAGPYTGWTEQAIIKPTSYGGPQGGISIPYEVHFNGGRTAVNVSLSGDTPTISS